VQGLNWILFPVLHQLGVSSPPVVTQWGTSPCDKNNDRRIQRREKRKMAMGRGSPCSCRRRRTTSRNVTTCTLRVRLDWAVESYNSVIDYRLMFRRVRRNPNPHSDVRLTNEEDGVSSSWTELSIPASPGLGPIHTKRYILRGLPSRHQYEAALTARNKYGVSQLSPIFYFSTFPRE